MMCMIHSADRATGNTEGKVFMNNAGRRTYDSGGDITFYILFFYRDKSA